MREYLKMLVYVMDIVAYIIFATIYLYTYLLILLLYHRFKFQYTLWRRRVPYNLRRQLLELYDEKMEELLNLKNFIRPLIQQSKLYSFGQHI